MFSMGAVERGPRPWPNSPSWSSTIPPWTPSTSHSRDPCMYLQHPSTALQPICTVTGLLKLRILREKSLKVRKFWLRFWIIKFLNVGIHNDKLHKIFVANNIGEGTISVCAAQKFVKKLGIFFYFLNLNRIPLNSLK